MYASVATGNVMSAVSHSDISLTAEIPLQI